MPFIGARACATGSGARRQLPVEDALRIAREAADALGYAHAEGDHPPRHQAGEHPAHRQRHALVADFGIARALGAAGDEKLTETGMAVGTPAYMSPEQASGQRELDAAHRHLLAGGGAVRDAGRRDAVRRRRRRRR